MTHHKNDWTPDRGIAAPVSDGDRLDALRLDLLTDLSHQLRTPVTALKLALETLHTQLDPAMTPGQRGLADIGRRNIERLVSLVENQIQLLQLSLGDRPTAHRLVDMRDVISRSVSGLFAHDARLIDLHVRDAARPQRVFADPEVVATLLRCVLGGGPPTARRSLELACDPQRGECTLGIRVRYLNGDCDDIAAAAPTPADAGIPVSTAPFDFERRAYEGMLERAGAHFTMEKSEDDKHITVHFPVLPAFDRDRDQLRAVDALRRSAESQRSRVDTIAVALAVADGTPAELTASLDRFHAHVSRTLTEGDLIVRGDHAVPQGHIPLIVALHGRSDEERAHIRRYISQCTVATIHSDTEPSHNEGAA